MKKSWLMHVLYVTGIGIILNMEVVKTRIFQYEDDDNDYLHVFDKRKLNDRKRNRYTRSTNEYERTSRRDNSHVNISTHFIFKQDSNNVAFVFWKHAKTTVIFILTCQNANTTNYNKHSNKGCKSKSKFYRSDDHGKSFVSITQGIERAHLHSIYLSPTNKSFITLTDYKNKTLYLTNDAGRTFTKYNVPFQPTYIYFHPVREDYIAAYDNTLQGENSLYLSEDRGVTWVRVAKKVRNYFWARGDYDDDDRTVFVEKESSKKIDSKTVSSFLYMISPPYNQSRLIYKQHLVPFSVYVGEKFILAQRIDDRKIYVSAGKRRSFEVAKFNKQTKAHVMYVVISDENSEILLALIHPLLQASLYLSDSTGENFRLQQTDILTDPIKNHVVPPKMDLYVVKGVYGTYIVNRRGKGSSITFDKGHTWRVIQVENKHVKSGKLNTRCGANACDLALYLKIENPFSDFTAPIISKANAPGIIIAQGHIGRYRPLEHLKHYVFMSTDGGYTWKQTLGTSNGYVILDHGGLIAATPLKSTSLSSAQITYSLNYGESWTPIHLTKMYSRIAAIITESTASLLVMNVFGFLNQEKSGSYKGNTWIVWHFNFSKVLNVSCKDDDYLTWRQNENACVMGERSSSKRRNSSKLCYSGPNFNNSLSQLPCNCTYKDYYCEKDYIRTGDKCAPINPEHRLVKTCEVGDYYKKTKGYIKHYGDKCKGGIEHEVSPTIERCKVTNPVILKIKASSTMVAVDKLVTFNIVIVDGVYNATYVWTFSDKNKQLRGSYQQMKKVNYKFQRSGVFNVTLKGTNRKGISITSIMVKVVDSLYIHPQIYYSHPVLVNKPTHFSLQTFVNGSLVLIKRPQNTKFLWSFDGVYVGGENSIALDHTLVTSGIVNMEVQVINGVSIEVLQERVRVYLSAVVVDLFFSKILDSFNTGTKTWIIDFETKYKNYLDYKHDLIRKGLSDRVIVRGSSGTPTRLSIIICDTLQTINDPDNKASVIANMIVNVINKNKPFVKGYEKQGVHVMRARIKSSEVHKDNTGDKYTWVYIVIVVIIMAVITLLMAYYRYRRKGSLLCLLYPHDSMNKQLVDDESDNEVEVADTPEYDI